MRWVIYLPCAYLAYRCLRNPDRAEHLSKLALLVALTAALLLASACGDTATPRNRIGITPASVEIKTNESRVSPTILPVSQVSKAEATPSSPGVAKPTGDPPSPTPALATPTQVSASPTVASASTPTLAENSTSTPTTDPAKSTPTITPTGSVSPAPSGTTIPPVQMVELRDVLGKSITSYAGSASARAHNVRLATERLNGKLIAPGEIFSFNKVMGPTTLSAGFQKGYGIILKEGQAETVESVGGGICQVSTTLFQAVYWAGLEIVERWYHLYWIPRYGQPPFGFTGLDATVDDPWVDFKFRNTTGNWIRIETKSDDSNIYFTLYGVNPGWAVVSSKPVVSNVVKTTQEVVRREDPQMQAGQELLIEHAEDGFEMTATRQVFDKDGKVLSTYRFVNRYIPARNVLLVGVKGATPTATPKPAFTPTPPQPKPAFTPTPPQPKPDEYRLPDGRIKVPNFVGMAEADAQKLINAVGLMTTYVNYQGPAEVPVEALKQVPVGHVLSQIPSPGQAVPEGTKVYLAVRKQ